MVGRVWLVSGVESARTSERMFCVTDRGCSAAFLFSVERTSRLRGAALSAGWLCSLDPRVRELSNKVR